MKIIANQRKKICKIVLLVLLFLSGLTGQFFSENSSLFAVCLAVVLLVVCIKFKAGSKTATIIYFAATLLGFAAMMSYPHILGISEKIASYRQYADFVSSLFVLAEKNFKLIAKDFTSYFFLWIAVSAAFVIIINKLQRQSANGGFLKILLSISKIIIIVYPLQRKNSCYFVYSCRRVRRAAARCISDRCENFLHYLCVYVPFLHENHCR